MPGELKNKSYRYTLLQDNRIVIDGKFPLPPGLLQTCRAVRHEASGIYYNENNFQTIAREFDCSSFRAINALRDKFDFVSDKSRVPNISMKTSGPPSWPNLNEWLQRHHAREAFGIAHDDFTAANIGTRRHERQKAAVGACFAVAYENRDLPWERIGKILEAQHIVLASLDARWK